MPQSVKNEIEHGWRMCDGGCGKLCMEATMLLVYRGKSKWLCAEDHALDMAQHPTMINQGRLPLEEYRKRIDAMPRFASVVKSASLDKPDNCVAGNLREIECKEKP